MASYLLLNYSYLDFHNWTLYIWHLLSLPTETDYYLKGLKTSIKHPMFRFMLLNPVDYQHFCQNVFLSVVDRKPSTGLGRYKYFVKYHDQHLSLAHNTPVRYRTEKLNLEIKFRGFYGEKVSVSRRVNFTSSFYSYVWSFFYDYSTMYKNRVPISMDHAYYARFVKPIINTEQGIDLFRSTNEIFRRGGVGGNHTWSFAVVGEVDQLSIYDKTLSDVKKKVVMIRYTPKNYYFPPQFQGGTEWTGATFDSYYDSASRRVHFEALKAAGASLDVEYDIMTGQVSVPILNR